MLVIHLEEYLVLSKFQILSLSISPPPQPYETQGAVLSERPDTKAKRTYTIPKLVI